MQVIGTEREVFYRERAAGMYKVEPWYLGKHCIVLRCDAMHTAGT